MEKIGKGSKQRQEDRQKKTFNDRIKHNSLKSIIERKMDKKIQVDRYRKMTKEAESRKEIDGERHGEEYKRQK